MKRIIALVLAAIFCLLTFCACGEKKEDDKGDSNKIQLTTENYKTYLDVNVEVVGGGKDYPNMFDSDPICYSAIDAIATVKGASSNYNYENVVITIKVSGEYEHMSGLSAYDWPSTDGKKPINMEDIVITTNIAGNGEGRSSMNVVDNFDGYGDYDVARMDWTYPKYEVVSVSGYVVPVSE